MHVEAHTQLWEGIPGHALVSKIVPTLDKDPSLERDNGEGGKDETS